MKHVQRPEARIPVPSCTARAEQGALKCSIGYERGEDVAGGTGPARFGARAGFVARVSKPAPVNPAHSQREKGAAKGETSSNRFSSAHHPRKKRRKPWRAPACRAPRPPSATHTRRRQRAGSRMRAMSLSRSAAGEQVWKPAPRRRVRLPRQTPPRAPHGRGRPATHGHKCQFNILIHPKPRLLGTQRHEFEKRQHARANAACLSAA
jgi:hypothetical protein